MADFCEHSGNTNILVTDLSGGEPSDFDTYVIYAELPPFCNPNPTAYLNACDIWNCNLCGNDRQYFIPFLATDWIYFQFFEHDYLSADWHEPDAINFKLYYNANNCNCNDTDWIEIPLVAGAVEGYNGVNQGDVKGSKFNFQVLRIHGSKLVELLGAPPAPEAPVLCAFSFKITFQNATGDYISYYSDCYRLVNCEDTVQLEGQYSGHDCGGFFYDLPADQFGTYTTLFPYRNVTRVYGSVKKTGNLLEVEKDDAGRPASSKLAGVYELRGRPIPPFVADHLIRILNGSFVEVDNIRTLYPHENSFNKQIEYSNMWRLRLNLVTEKCFTYHGCL